MEKINNHKRLQEQTTKILVTLNVMRMHVKRCMVTLQSKSWRTSYVITRSF